MAIMTEFELRKKTRELTDIYFQMLGNYDLTESNKILLEKINYKINETQENYPNTPLSDEIRTALKEYEIQTKGIQTKGIQTTNIYENYKTGSFPITPTKEARALVRIKKESNPNTKAGNINIFILIYGMINIGFIIAVAFLK